MRELIPSLIKNITSEQAERFDIYYRMLIEWNEKINLTAITEKEEVAQKHFADSVLPMNLIPNGAKCIDIGTGAGFPGIPLLIMRDDIDLTLLDSLNKRLIFVEQVLDELGLKAKIVHARGEDGARKDELREKFDIALTRAVSSTPSLIELTVPYLKVNGRSLMYKGPKADEELSESKNALSLLKASASIRVFDAPWGERNIIECTKLERTAKQYPRKAPMPVKKPL